MELTLTINQERAVAWDLSMGESLLFSYLVLPSGWMKPHPTDGSYRWLSTKKLALEMPMVCSHVASVRRHMKSLEDKGLIERTVHESMSYYRVTEKGWLWRSPTASMAPPELPPQAEEDPRADRRDPPSGSAHPPRADRRDPPSGSAHQSVPPDHYHQGSGCTDAQEPEKAIEWVQVFVTEHGYQMGEARTGATMAMFANWIESGVTRDEVAQAMLDAAHTLGQKPNGPGYLHKVIGGNRSKGATLKDIGKAPAKRTESRAERVERMTREMEADYGGAMFEPITLGQAS